jgi:hypothetical protein
MVLFLAAGAVLAARADLGRRIASLQPADVPEGIGVFALFYVVTQFIERLVEGGSFLFDTVRSWASRRNVPIVGQGTPKQEAVADLKAAQVDLLTAETEPEKREATQEVKESEKKVDKAAKDRMAFFWGFATLLGVLAALMFGLRFLAVVGVTDGTGAERWDVFITGMVVGGGTQVLHGLIGKVKASSASSSATSP